MLNNLLLPNESGIEDVCVIFFFFKCGLFTGLILLSKLKLLVKGMGQPMI